MHPLQVLQLLQRYLIQYHYTTFTLPPSLWPLSLPPSPSAAELLSLYASLDEADVERRSAEGSERTEEAKVAFEVRRADNAFLFYQLERSGTAQVNVPMPLRGTTYWNVRVLSARVFVWPLPPAAAGVNDVVRIALTKGPSSSFFTSPEAAQAGTPRAFVHAQPSPSTTQYRRSDCSDSRATLPRDDQYIQYSPYGTWNVTGINIAPGLFANATSLRLVFDVSYKRVQASSDGPLFGGQAQVRGVQRGDDAHQRTSTTDPAYHGMHAATKPGRVMQQGHLSPPAPPYGFEACALPGCLQVELLLDGDDEAGGCADQAPAAPAGSARTRSAYVGMPAPALCEGGVYEWCVLSGGTNATCMQHAC